MPSCIRAPPPEPETITSGSFCRVASSMARVSFSPTTEPMLPMMKPLSVRPKTMRMPLMNPWPTTAASFRPVRSCSAFDALGVGPAVVEPERVAGAEVGIPLLERVGVEELGDPVDGRDREVVVALGADVEVLLDLLAEERGLAAVAPHPDAFGHPLGLEVAVPGVGGSSLSYGHWSRTSLARLAGRGGSGSGDG